MALPSNTRINMALGNLSGFTWQYMEINGSTGYTSNMTKHQYDSYSYSHIMKHFNNPT